MKSVADVGWVPVLMSLLIGNIFSLLSLQTEKAFLKQPKVFLW